MANNPYADIDDSEAAPLAPQVAPEPISSDRGEATTKSPKKRKKGMLFAIAGVIIFSLVAVSMFGYFFYNAMRSKAAASAESVPTDPALERKVADGPDLGQVKEKVKKEIEDAEERKREEELEAAKLLEAAQAAANADAGGDAAPSRGRLAGQQQNAGNGGSGSRGADKRELTPQEIADARKFDGDVLWSGGGSGSGGAGSSGLSGGQDSKGSSSRSARAAPMSVDERIKANPALAKAMAENGTGDVEESGSSSENIGSLLKTEKNANGTVFARPDLKFLLINGTTIPCTLLPRIVTDYPGQTRCLVNRDVYSADGSVLLVGRGSTANGERKVSIKAGQGKVFVAWGSIDTTDGLKINVDSMAADSLGAAGLDAIIDNHYGERFGGAILLSFLDDVFQAVARNSGSNDGVTFDSSTKNAEDMASIALQNSINIPPTGYVQHATELNIIVARDIDFRSVYAAE